MLRLSDTGVKDVAWGLAKKRFFLLMFSMLVATIPSCALGFSSVFGIFHSSNFLMTLLCMAGVLVGLFAPVVVGPVVISILHREPARRFIDELVQMERDVVSKCLAALPHPAYFNATSALHEATNGLHGGAIAVDPVSQKIALEIGQLQPGTPINTRSIVLNPGELRSWRAEQSDLSTLELIGSGHSGSTRASVASHNAQQRREQAFGTGLRLQTERLDATEIFLTFDYEIAKGWVALLDKLAAGRLEAPSEAVEFPKS